MLELLDTILRPQDSKVPAWLLKDRATQEDWRTARKVVSEYTGTETVSAHMPSDTSQRTRSLSIGYDMCSGVDHHVSMSW